MSRPEKNRTVCMEPRCTYFKPRGIPLRALETVELTLDELETLRLCYREGLYQEQAAQTMDVSRQTVGRILNSAFAKVAEALVEGKALKIKGGNVTMKREFQCSACGHSWEVAYGIGRPSECPACKSANIHRHPEDRGCARRGRGRGRGFGCRMGQGPPEHD